MHLMDVYGRFWKFLKDLRSCNQSHWALGDMLHFSPVCKYVLTLLSGEILNKHIGIFIGKRTYHCWSYA